MAIAEHSEVFPVSMDQLFEVITRYEDYPQFLEGCSEAEVERKGPGEARVSFHVNMMKEVHYTIDHREDRKAGCVEWKLVESDFFKKNEGRWELKEISPGKTEATYRLEVEFKVPVPGFILNRLVKGSLPSMIKSFGARARKLAKT